MRAPIESRAVHRRHPAVPSAAYPMPNSFYAALPSANSSATICTRRAAEARDLVWGGIERVVHAADGANDVTRDA
jgi:hypothetical protein